MAKLFENIGQTCKGDFQLRPGIGDFRSDVCSLVGELAMHTVVTAQIRVEIDRRIELDSVAVLKGLKGLPLRGHVVPLLMPMCSFLLVH